MKIILLILLSICTVLNAAEYPRYKSRTPPRQRRVPPSQQFSKKWHQGGPLLQAHQGLPQGIPQGLAQGIPHGLPQGLSQGLPQGMQGIHQGHHQFSLRGPPVRQRPVNHIPMLMGTNTHNSHSHKMPPNGLHHQLAPQRPVTSPVRNFWKNPINSVKLQSEVIFKAPVAVPPSEKPFRSAPSIPSQEFDYHIQTNQIPTTHINPIKQIGEKGPIHTIPAPNLSLKDKPIIVDEVRNDISFQHPSYVNNHVNNYPNNHLNNHVNSHGNSHVNSHVNDHINTHVTIQKSHEYQVTEPPEHNQKLFRAQQEHQKQIQLQIQKQIQQMQQQNAQQDLQNQHQQMLQQELQNQQQQILLASDPIPVHQSLEPNPQEDIILSNNLSPKDLYQLVNANYPQLQLQKGTSSSNVQLFQPDITFLDHFPQEPTQVASDKVSFQPEYQSFNYDEQAHQKSLSKKDMSSLVSATYNLGSDKEISSRNSMDPLTQAELVQHYFDTRSDIAENKIEADAKPSSKDDNADEKLIETSFYSSLPNKEAAERLAQLQTAGKINSNLMKLSNAKQDSKEPLTIVISDEYESDEDTIKGSRKEEPKEDQRDYDEYSQEENISSEEGNSEFGHRIQPKKKAE